MCPDVLHPELDGPKERWKWAVCGLAAVGFVLFSGSAFYLAVGDWKPCAVTVWAGITCYVAAIAVALGADL